MTKARPRAALEVLIAFMKLGVSSFGGPIAHLGYFREEFVVRRRWLPDQTYADLVALCQFLPGPASSQVGFSLGLLRAGFLGGLAAWAGFTLPSAVLLVLFALGANALNPSLFQGLQLVAVAIVAQALWGMARSLCPDRERASIATLATLAILLAGTAWVQVAVIFLGGVAGFFLCRTLDQAPIHALPIPVSRRIGVLALVVFFLLLVGLPGFPVFNAFYRSGALVFGGGHVVLPLLREAVVVPGWVSDDAFLAGYGAAQAVPGPLFTFAAYLGTILKVSPHGVGGAVLCLVALFLPGLLVLVGTLPFWEDFRRHPNAQAVMRGINAAVVGLLAAALYSPVFSSAVKTPQDFGIAAAGFILLTVWRAPPLLVVALSVLGKFWICWRPGC
ncbi:MAG TPA: chromate efflux transporter [Stellaceae bacterium]|nr:chromate efflux transporter [Stellaceae bacterium]